MSSQSTDSSTQDSAPDTSITRLPAYYLLLGFRWAVSSSNFLYFLATIVVGGSLLVSFSTQAWHRLQRSGALLVSIGALLSTRRALALMLDALIDGNDLVRQVQGERVAGSEAGELRMCLRIFVGCDGHFHLGVWRSTGLPATIAAVLPGLNNKRK